MRRTSTAVLAVALAVSALAAALHGQAPAAGTPRGKNLQVLSPDVNLDAVMARFNAGLGVQCTYCHVADDFASDANPKKLIARGMIGMMKEINAALFPNDDIDIVLAAASEPPPGKHYVTCYTCHRGTHLPVTER
jgi:hypothetical protein